MIGKVTSVEDDQFTIHFEIPGLVEDGIAIPLHTMQEPVEGDEIEVTGGDDILNTFFVYQLTQPSLPCIWKAYDNYLQNIKGAGIQMVSKDGDTLMDAGNCAMMHGKSGAGVDGDGGPVMIKNGKSSLEDILKLIHEILIGTASIYQAAGMPVNLVDPSKLTQLGTKISQLFGTVEVPIMDDGGGPGSSSAGSSPASASPTISPVNIKTIVTQMSTQIKAGIVSPMGPCTAPGEAAVDALINTLK